METHISYLALALKLAEIRRGFCAPNPAVGAVVVKDQRVLATGYHWACGHPHAEVEALTRLTPEETRGATLYITLEPCCHWGKTAPCTDLIIERGIQEVFYGYRDPNPKVAGKGEAILRRAGISCREISFAPLVAFYKSYRYWWQTGQPFVTAKLAMSMDSKIAAAHGAPVSITGDRLRQYTHEQRKSSDAILTTAVTINRDNPQLNIRLENETFSKPIFILDSHLTLSMTAKIFETAQRIVLFHQSQPDEVRLQQLRNLNVTCIEIEHDQHGLNLRQVLDYIGKQGVHDLWIEAGGKCFQSFLAANLLQRALIYIAPKLLGASALNAFTAEQDILTQAKNIRWQGFGKDVMCEIDYVDENFEQTYSKGQTCLQVS